MGEEEGAYQVGVDDGAGDSDVRAEGVAPVGYVSAEAGARVEGTVADEGECSGRLEERRGAVGGAGGGGGGGAEGGRRLG